MKLLSIECSATPCSVALAEDEKILSKIEEDKNPEKTEHKKISLGETESVDLSEFTDEEDSVPEEQIPEKFKTLLSSSINTSSSASLGIIGIGKEV